MKSIPRIFLVFLFLVTTISNAQSESVPVVESDFDSQKEYGQILIGAFNIRKFGVSKVNKQQVVEILVKVIKFVKIQFYKK